MTKAEEKDLEALKVGFEMTEWEDFLLVYNEIKHRYKDIIKMYRDKNTELIKQKKELRQACERVKTEFGKHSAIRLNNYALSQILEIALNNLKTETDGC